MKNILLFVLISSFTLFSFPRKSLVERYTNASCGPCASLNAAWYTATLHDAVATETVTHVVYNVNWPGANDPMYLLNAQDNAIKWSYYGVNSVPWICINGSTLNSQTAAAFTSTVNAGNQTVSPFKIVITPEKINNNYSVQVKVIRDITDTEVYTRTRVKVALTEKTVAYSAAPGTNGEKTFFYIVRKMLPDARGISFDIPAAGDSVTLNFQFVPNASWLSKVNPDSICVVAFIQNDGSKYVYQSEKTDAISSTNISSLFTYSSDVIAVNDTITFTDYSTGKNGNPITSWKWDFNNDGTVDATVQNPSYKFTKKGIYSVSLTVSDGTNQAKRIVPEFNVLGNSSETLVVNGLDIYYGDEVRNFYNESACFGNHNVDIWDLFGDQGVNYTSNIKVKQTALFPKNIPSSYLKLYKNVIWIGNNYGGDFTYYDQQQILDYVKAGGNFVLAVRQGKTFLNGTLSPYLGITNFSADLTVNQLLPFIDNLDTMVAMNTNSLVNLVEVDTSSYTTILFKDDMTSTFSAGIMVNKPGNGKFIYVAGRPYRFNLTASAHNYNFIIDSLLASPLTGVSNGDKNLTPHEYSLDQNYPNPFNPSTVINYSLPLASKVKISIYNALGQLVSVPVNLVQNEGNYSFKFNSQGLSSGIYIYNIQTSSVDGSKNWYSSRKMVLLK